MIATLAVLTTLAISAGAHAMTLADDGRSEYVIAVAQNAIAPEQTAARELQSFLQQVTGAKLPIVLEADSVGQAKRIVVGQSQALKAARPELNLAALKHDGIVLCTRGDTLFLAGGRPRGTLYAVYTFLEDTVGCRWWSSTESTIPKKPTLEIPYLDTVYVPKLQYREAFYRDAFEGIYAARSKCNGHFERVPAEYGGHYNLLGWCHTFERLLPPSKYFEAHPEWYSEINGKRSADRTQICLTNEEARKELTRNALEWIRKDPSAGMISIAQNDWAGQCQCANCRKVVEEEGSESGPLLRFVNAVAADIEKEYPDFLIETLAYHYTRTPPKLVKPRGNVVVRLCSIECSYVQPLATGEQNAKFRSDVEGWKAVAPQLYIWDYVTNFANYILPHPNLRVLAPNIRYFVDSNCIGLFEQGDSGSSCGDFVELRAWLIAHLMWEPTRDDRALIAEFLRGYYGPAADALQQYIDFIHDTAEKSGVYLRCYMNDTSAWMDLEAMNRATDLFAKATAAAGDDPVYGPRVRRARMPLDYAWLQRQKALRTMAKMTGKPFLGPADPAAFCEEFIEAAHKFNIGSYAEGRAFKDIEAGLRSQAMPIGQGGTPPSEVAGLPVDAWVDIQESEFTLHGVGNWATMVDDATASNGRAARMPANHNQWAVQYPLSGDLSGLGRWHCYAVVRCEPKTAKGGAFSLGLYDSKAAAGAANLDVTLEQAADGKYHAYDLGVHDLRAGLYFWVAPKGDPNAVGAVYVDRFFLVREK
jgi:hypothetical protein